MRSFAVLAIAWSLAPVVAYAKSDNTLERVVMASFGDCVVKRHHDEAAQAILSDASNEVFQGKSSNLASVGCLKSAAPFIERMRADGDAYRGAIANALVRVDLGDAVTPNLSAVPALDHRVAYPVEAIDKKTGKFVDSKTLARREEGFRAAQLRNWRSRIGECIVRSDTAGARTLLATAISGDGELAALKALSPVLPGCLPAGMKLTFDRAGLRDMVAVNYYRLAMAARGMPIGAAR